MDIATSATTSATTSSTPSDADAAVPDGTVVGLGDTLDDDQIQDMLKNATTQIYLPVCGAVSIKRQWIPNADGVDEIHFNVESTDGDVFQTLIENYQTYCGLVDNPNLDIWYQFHRMDEITFIKPSGSSTLAWDITVGVVDKPPKQYPLRLLSTPFKLFPTPTQTTVKLKRSDNPELFDEFMRERVDRPDYKVPFGGIPFILGSIKLPYVQSTLASIMQGLGPTTPTPILTPPEPKDLSAGSFKMSHSIPVHPYKLDEEQTHSSPSPSTPTPSSTPLPAYVDFEPEYPSQEEMETRVIHSFGKGTLPVGELFDPPGSEKYMKELRFRWRRATM